MRTLNDYIDKIGFIEIIRKLNLQKEFKEYIKDLIKKDLKKRGCEL